VKHHILLLALTALAASACAPEGEGESKESTPLPLGYELAVVQAESDAVRSTVIDLSVDELQTMLAKGGVRLIDIRRDDEVAAGMISGAEHIAMEAFDPTTLDTSDGREIVLYCRSGRRSRIVGEKLAAHTGKPAKHLSGGIIAWRAAGRSR